MKTTEEKVNAKIYHRETFLTSALLHLVEVQLKQKTAWCGTMLLTEDEMRDLGNHEGIFVRLEDERNGFIQIYGWSANFGQDIYTTDFVGVRN